MLASRGRKENKTKAGGAGAAAAASNHYRAYCLLVNSVQVQQKRHSQTQARSTVHGQAHRGAEPQFCSTPCPIKHQARSVGTGCNRVSEE